MSSLDQSKQDAQERNDEIEALQAIFTDEFRQINDDSFEIQIDKDLCIRVCLPSNYPSTCPPLFELQNGLLTDEQIISLSNQLEDMAASNLGEVVIFKWVEFLREHAPSVSFDGDAVQQDIAEENAEESTDLDSCEYITHDAEWAPADHQHLASPEIHEKWSACIVSGDILVDRKSTFQAHLAPVRSVADVSDLLTVLKSNNKIARATHNIMAYRIVHKEGAVIADCDDDGESAAGGRLLHLLSILDVKDVCVVVSRWYGGIQLGPDRFKHINNVARALLAARGYVGAGDRDGPGGGDPVRRRR